MQHFIHAFKLYGVFSGRSTREEYWMFTLIYFLMYAGLSLIAFMLNSDAFQVVLSLLSLAVLIPTLSITSRRLHDVGRSGWWQVSPYLGMVFAIIGILQESKFLMISGGIFMLSLLIIVLVFLVESSQEDNTYGIKPS